ncbi:MAG TPA: D-alanyl-D-alanine carboxypeptidase family protein [Alphaproteobacteria bacterium]|nr:D-alanyl-D-alanine carboxypeptidase family protein [Alphaproteobacteria bacterium]
MTASKPAAAPAAIPGSRPLSISNARAPRRALVCLCATLALVAAWLGHAPAASAELPTIDTSAQQAILIDFDTGAVLFAKNADQRMAPSSMAKMMTLYILFSRLKEGRIKLDDTLPVSEKAWRTGGSKMFVMVGSRVTVQNLIQGIAVQSGNDACIVVAEGLDGTEQAFADEMNRTARQLGMINSHFVDASGLPDPDQYVTARDLSILARDLIKQFPEYYHYFNEIDFTYNGIKQGNRNPLLYYKDIGDGIVVDGVKTGHTEQGGYGLTASGVHNGRRLLVVLNGMQSVNERAREGEKLLDWGFREWGDYALFKSNEKMGDADVWLGDQPTVPLIADHALTVTLPRASRDKMKVTLVYDNPIPAPIKMGAVVGKIVVEAPDAKTEEVALRAGASVGRLGFMGRIGAAVRYLVYGGPPMTAGPTPAPAGGAPKK